MIVVSCDGTYHGLPPREGGGGEGFRNGLASDDDDHADGLRWPSEVPKLSRDHAIIRWGPVRSCGGREREGKRADKCESKTKTSDTPLPKRKKKNMP